MRFSIGLAAAIVVAILAYAFGCAPETQRADWVMVALTVALIYVGGTQAYIYWNQARLMRKTVKETRRSAKAANAAVKSTRALERAVIVVDPKLPPEQHPNTIGADNILLWISYTTVNLGRSHAWIREHRVTTQVVPFPHITEGLPTPGVVTNLEPVSTFPILPSKEGAPYKLARRLDRDQQNSLVNGHAAIMLFGEIEYQDAFGETDVHRFSWVYTRSPKSEPGITLTWGNRSGDAGDIVWVREWRVLNGPASYFKKPAEDG